MKDNEKSSNCQRLVDLFDIDRIGCFLRLALAIETAAHLSKFADLSILEESFIVVAVAIFSNEFQNLFASPSHFLQDIHGLIYKRASYRIYVLFHVRWYSAAAAAPTTA